MLLLIIDKLVYNRYKLSEACSTVQKFEINKYHHKLKQKRVYDDNNYILLVMLMLIHLAFFIRLFATGMGHWLINISVRFERLYRMHTRPQFSGSTDT